VKISSIINAGKGVFAKEFILSRIGSYKGEVVQKEDVTNEIDMEASWLGSGVYGHHPLIEIIITLQEILLRCFRKQCYGFLYQ